MDIVYVVRPGEDNEELRYSLRSVAAHVPHDRVWIAGHRPAWVSDDVGVIEVPQLASAFRNSTANLRAACEHPEVSQEFAYFNDDFFVMEDVGEIPVLHRGPLADVIAGTRSSLYRRGAQATALKMQRLGLPEPLLSYEVHAPMVLDKDLMVQALDAGAGLPVLHKRSLYGNLHGIGGQQVTDVKVKAVNVSVLPDGPYVSTTDDSFRNGLIGVEIRKAFPDPCRYERNPDTAETQAEAEAGADTPEPEAADEPVDQGDHQEPETEPDTPVPPAEGKPAPPAVRAPKAEWVAYADAQDPGDHTAMTKDELVKTYGG